MTAFVPPDDPTYPKAIEPILYAYDEYQTYDLIKAENISAIVKDFSAQLAQIGLYFWASILIERYTPFDFAWAEDYSLALYNFLKDFSGTDYYGSFFPAQLKEQIDFPFLEEYKFSDFPKVTIPKGEGMVIFTWLQIDREDTGGILKAERVLIKRKRIYRQADKDYVAKIPAYDISLCSFVVSGNSSEAVQKVEEEIDKLSKGYLYKNFQSLLSSIKQIILSKCPDLYDVPDTVSASKSFEYRYDRWYLEVRGYEYGDYNKPMFTYQQNKSIIEQESVSPETDYGIFSKRKRPDWYTGAGLIYANNNYWKNSRDRQSILPHQPFYQLIPTGISAAVQANFLKNIIYQGDNLPPIPPYSDTSLDGYQTWGGIWELKINFEVVRPGLIPYQSITKSIIFDVMQKGSDETYLFLGVKDYSIVIRTGNNPPDVTRSRQTKNFGVYTWEREYWENPRRLGFLYFAPPTNDSASISASLTASYYDSAAAVPVDNEINDGIFVEFCKQQYLLESLDDAG